MPRESLRFTLTWGLGGAAAMLMVLQLGTGVLLKFAYQPFPATAYESVRQMISLAPFGRLLRNLHYWGAQLLVVFLCLHLLRAVFTGAYRAPRRLTWTLGLALLAAVLAANLSGYLLPYDQLAFWAVTVTTGMLEYVPVVGRALQDLVRGGPGIGPASLRMFFAAHTALIPIVLVLLAAFHFWRVRKAGGVVAATAPAGDRGDRLPAWPHLLVRELAAAAALAAGLLLLAIAFDAPLADPANPGLSPNPTKAPWYFAGFQELLLHLPPAVAVFMLPGLAVAALAVLPWVPGAAEPAGVWFGGRRGRCWTVVSAAAGTLAGPLFVLAAAGLNPVGALLPAAALVAAVAGWHQWLRRRRRATRNEALLAVFAFMTAAFASLTAIGAVLRGADMALSVPW